MRTNNFDILRLLASSFVIITHSYALSGNGETDFLSYYSKGTISFSHLGVAIFFVISGYLILNSAIFSCSAKSYFWKRLLRILPGLLVVLLGSVFILGPILTSKSAYSYFMNIETYKHFYTISIYNIGHLNLPGVFSENHNSAVNGSLWTLQYEFTCYLLVAFLVFIIKSEKIKLTYLVYFLFFLFISARFLLGDRYFWFNYSSPYLFNLNIMYLTEWFIYFTAGMVLYFIKDKFNYFNWLTILLLGLFIILVSFNYLSFARLALYFLVPVVVYYFAFLVKSIQIPTQIGDISYGMYIYAFPIQQTILNFYPSIKVEYLIFVSIICTIPFAFLSWHFIEKRALKFKNLY